MYAYTHALKVFKGTPQFEVQRHLQVYIVQLFCVQIKLKLYERVMKMKQKKKNGKTKIFLLFYEFFFSLHICFLSLSLSFTPVRECVVPVYIALNHLIWKRSHIYS